MLSACAARLSLHRCRHLMKRLLHLPSRRANAVAALRLQCNLLAWSPMRWPRFHGVHPRAQTGQNGVVGLVVDPLARSGVRKSPDGCADVAESTREVRQAARVTLLSYGCAAWGRHTNLDWGPIPGAGQAVGLFGWMAGRPHSPLETGAQKLEET